MSIEQELNRIANALETLVGASQKPAPSIEPKKASPPVGRPPKTTPPPAVKQAEAPTNNQYSKAQVFAALRQHADKHTADITKTLMKKYGATSPKVDEIPAEQYPFIMAEIENDLAGVI